MELATLQQSAVVANSNGANNDEHEALARVKELEHYKSEVSLVILQYPEQYPNQYTDLVCKIKGDGQQARD